MIVYFLKWKVILLIQIDSQIFKIKTELELDLSKSNIIPFKLMDNDAGQNAQYFTKHRIHFEIQTNPRYMEQIKAYYAEDIKLYNQ